MKKRFKIMKEYLNDFNKSDDLNKKYFLWYTLKYSVILGAVLSLIDKYNLLSKYLFWHSNNESIILIFSLLLLVVLVILQYNVWQIVKIHTINSFDRFIMIILYSGIFYIGESVILKQIFLYKIIIAFLVLIVFIGLLLYRANRYINCKQESKKYKENVIDLKDLFEKKFKSKQNKMILLKEKDVDYDLLERSSIINQLFNAINECNPNDRFVISLEGKWGSGKTTIINNVIKKFSDERSEDKKDIVIIDEFDPWTYSDQESMLYNMFDLILKKTGFTYSTLSMKQMINNIYTSILGTKKVDGIFKAFFRKPNQIIDIKNKINNYLKVCNKRVVFFIDNIDRAESKNVILLFKLVANVFDFERVTYILCFDDERIKKVFDNDLNTDYKFLKKVIQMQIKVNEIDKNVLNTVFKTCINNLFNEYGEVEENLKYYEPVINCVCKQIKDVRDFKRFINSVISGIFNGKSYLDKRDLLAIQYIRFYNLNLYQSIYKNRKFFISYDKFIDSECYSTMINEDEFLSQSEQYFKDLFSIEENDNYITLLSEIFPCVKRYKFKQKIRNPIGYYDDIEYSDIVKNKRICSAKYFDLYFTYTENDYLLLHEVVSNFVKNINSSSTIDERKDAFDEFIKPGDKCFQKEKFEVFQFYLEDLKQECIFNVINVLYDNIDKINDYLIYSSDKIYPSGTARSRVAIIINILLHKITEEKFHVFLNEKSKEYKNIAIINEIFPYCNSNRVEEKTDKINERGHNLYKKMTNEILNRSINIYDDRYYFPKNIWGIYGIYRDDNIRIREYIKPFINEETVFRFIYDTIILKFDKDSRKYQYYLSKDYLNALVSKEYIDDILENVKPKTEDEKFVFKIYKTGEDDCIITEDEKKFKL